MVDAKLRAWWAHKQGLDGSLAGRNASDVLAAAGWARSVGGAAPYLTLFARARLRRADVDAELARAAIHELPSARGCTYVLPARDFALGLKVGQGFSDEQEMKTARKLGVTDDEIVRLRGAVARALAKCPLDPDALKSAVGPASRSLGPEGAKKGLATTLPLALGQMQSEGEIRRIPKNGRIDQQRYQYALWEPNPLSKWPLDTGQSFVELARLYFGWVGAANLEEFQWFSGLGVKAAKAATDPLGLVQIHKTDDENRLMLPADREAFEKFKAPKQPQYELVASIDGISLLRRNLRSLLAEEHLSLDLAQPKSTVLETPGHKIVDRGTLVGVWEYDTETESIAWLAFDKLAPGKAGAALTQAVRLMETYIREDLGDARSFSLDSPKSRAPRIAALRQGKVAAA